MHPFHLVYRLLAPFLTFVLSTILLPRRDSVAIAVLNAAGAWGIFIAG